MATKLPKNAPIHNKNLNSSAWIRWFERVGKWFYSGAPAIVVEEENNLPDPRNKEGAWVLIKNDSKMVYSDGSNWRDLDGNTI